MDLRTRRFTRTGQFSRTLLFATALAVAAGCGSTSSVALPSVVTPAPTVVAPAPEPTSTLAPDVIPAARMTLSAQNGTTLTVNLVVNGSLVRTLLAGSQVSDIRASDLPPLPWLVEARTIAGRILLTMTVNEGDVAASAGASRGDAARVDLSCGRLDMWSGPPILGPAPGPGTPGDCDIGTPAPSPTDVPVSSPTLTTPPADVLMAEAAIVLARPQAPGLAVTETRLVRFREVASDWTSGKDFVAAPDSWVWIVRFTSADRQSGRAVLLDAHSGKMLVTSAWMAES